MWRVGSDSTAPAGAPVHAWWSRQDRNDTVVDTDAAWEESHASLLVPVVAHSDDAAQGKKPDAIAVPTCRPHPEDRAGIRFALDLAEDLGRPVVFLCSRDAAEPEAVKALRELVDRRNGVEALIICTAETGGDTTLLPVDRHLISTAYRRGGNRPGDQVKVPLNDVGRKRNFVLMLAFAMSWRHLLFLDDDVYPLCGRTDDHPPTLNSVTLSAAVRRIEASTLRAIGWVLRDYPDNSVLCRMRGELGEDQDQFIGGGALLIAVDASTPFFPAIYNEDWLFLLAYYALGHSQPLGWAGDVGQEPYEPYTPNRARAEEFGDILGEALASRVGRVKDFWCADKRYWQKALAARVQLRRELEVRVGRSPHPLAGSMLDALHAIGQVHSLLGPASGWPERFAQYGPQWIADLDVWQSRLEAAAAAGAMALLTGPEVAGVPEPAGAALAVDRFLERWDRTSPTCPLSQEVEKDSVRDGKPIGHRIPRPRAFAATAAALLLSSLCLVQVVKVFFP